MVPYPTAHPVAFSNCLHLALSEPSPACSIPSPWNYGRAPGGWPLHCLQLKYTYPSSTVSVVCQAQPEGSLPRAPSFPPPSQRCLTAKFTPCPHQPHQDQQQTSIFMGTLVFLGRHGATAVRYMSPATFGAIRQYLWL